MTSPPRPPKNQPTARIRAGVRVPVNGRRRAVDVRGRVNADPLNVGDCVSAARALHVPGPSWLVTLSHTS
jgi:hypothetical protein